MGKDKGAKGKKTPPHDAVRKRTLARMEEGQAIQLVNELRTIGKLDKDKKQDEDDEEDGPTLVQQATEFVLKYFKHAKRILDSISGKARRRSASRAPRVGGLSDARALALARSLSLWRLSPLFSRCARSLSLSRRRLRSRRP